MRSSGQQRHRKYQSGQTTDQSINRSIDCSVGCSVSQSIIQPASQSVSQSFSMEYISYLNLRLARLCDRRGEIHSRTTGLSVVKYLSRSHLECKSLTQNGIAQLHSAMFYAMVCVLYWHLEEELYQVELYCIVAALCSCFRGHITLHKHSNTHTAYSNPTTLRTIMILRLRMIQLHYNSLSRKCIRPTWQIDSIVCYLRAQLLPYFVVTIFADTPGFSGIFLAALYGGALR